MPFLCLVLVCAASLVSSLAMARPVQVVTPEDLEARSDVVCNGRVLSVEKMGAVHMVAGVETEPMRARIEVLHCFKGKVPVKIELDYDASTLREAERPNAAERIVLQTGARCRFFLKAVAAPYRYINALDGMMDDAFAVEILSPKEADASPYLKVDDARRIALKFAEEEYPKFSYDGESHIYCEPNAQGGAEWLVTLFELPRPNPRFASVSVRGDGTIDRNQTSLND